MGCSSEGDGMGMGGWNGGTGIFIVLCKCAGNTVLRDNQTVSVCMYVCMCAYSHKIPDSLFRQIPDVFQ